MRRLSRTAWLPLVLSAFAGPALAASPLDGAWRLESGEFVDAEGRHVAYAGLRRQGTTLLADGHFSFTTTQHGPFWAGSSGTFSADADTCVGKPRMAPYPLPGDGHYRFCYTLDGDTWTLGGTRVERDAWRRAAARP